MIYVCEHHHEMLAHWRLRELTDIALTHVDFHDDLRGLLVDRRRGVAYPIGNLARGEDPVDAGNFLAHAVLEGHLRRARWVHGRIGGRAWDVGIVRYESDMLAMHHRLRHWMRIEHEVPFVFEEILLESWGGPRPGELLTVDWDCFASILTDENGIDSRVDEFFGRLGESVPADTWVAYSPEYSHPSLDRFKGFAQRLGERFSQDVDWLSPDLADGRLTPTGVQAKLPTDPLMRLVLFLRRNGIY